MGTNGFDVQPVVAEHWFERVIGGIAFRDVELGVTQVTDVSFSEDDCTNLLEVMPEVQAAPDNEVSECIYTILGYA